MQAASSKSLLVGADRGSVLLVLLVLGPCSATHELSAESMTKLPAFAEWGGKAGLTLISVSSFLGLAVLLALALLFSYRDAFGPKLAHLGPLAIIQFLDFATDVFLIAEFFIAEDFLYFSIGARLQQPR